jgi:hypothetical protein
MRPLVAEPQSVSTSHPQKVDAPAPSQRDPSGFAAQALAFPPAPTVQSWQSPVAVLQAGALGLEHVLLVAEQARHVPAWRAMPSFGWQAGLPAPAN